MQGSGRPLAVDRGALLLESPSHVDSVRTAAAASAGHLLDAADPVAGIE
jgi:hypothetical protein